MEKDENMKLALFKLNTKNYKKFKMLSVNSNLTMMEILNDLIEIAIENDKYELKYEENRINK